ncbi:MAG TPA: universal stress protein [Acidimicrobiales bacterium]|nr:universal stress protein [Acidimicrobiales bacterium]
MTGEDRRVLLAALDDTPAAHDVLMTALGTAHLVGATVEVLHVAGGHHSARIAAGAAGAAGVPLRVARGAVAETILGAMDDPTVVGAVVGTRAFRGGPRPAGSVARRVLAGASKTVVFVPPDLRRPTADAPRRLLVPLDGSAEASAGFFELERELRPDVEREITVLLTFDGVRPAMLDHPVRDIPEWGREFLARYCPGERRTFQGRSGNPGDAVIEVADATGSELIVLTSSGNIEGGHGAVVREVLTRSRVPVLVLPVPCRKARSDGTAVTSVSTTDSPFVTFN